MQLLLSALAVGGAAAFCYACFAKAFTNRFHIHQAAMLGFLIFALFVLVLR